MIRRKLKLTSLEEAGSLVFPCLSFEIGLPLGLKPVFCRSKIHLYKYQLETTLQQNRNTLTNRAKLACFYEQLRTITQRKDKE